EPPGPAPLTARGAGSAGASPGGTAADAVDATSSAAVAAGALPPQPPTSTAAPAAASARVAFVTTSIPPPGPPGADLVGRSSPVGRGSAASRWFPIGWFAIAGPDHPCTGSQRTGAHRQCGPRAGGRASAPRPPQE